MHAGPADHFEIGDLRQLRQNVVLNAVRKESVLLLSLRFSNERTAIPAGIRRTDSRSQTIRLRLAASMTDSSMRAAIIRFRWTHFWARVKNPLRFARIGSCLNQRSRSSASARADE